MERGFTVYNKNPLKIRQYIASREEDRARYLAVGRRITSDERNYRADISTGGSKQNGVIGVYLPKKKMELYNRSWK